MRNLQPFNAVIPYFHSAIKKIGFIEKVWVIKYEMERVPGTGTFFYGKLLICRASVLFGLCSRRYSCDIGAIHLRWPSFLYRSYTGVVPEVTEPISW